jgi:hypothetical protein
MTQVYQARKIPSGGRLRPIVAPRNVAVPSSRNGRLSAVASFAVSAARIVIENRPFCNAIDNRLSQSGRTISGSGNSCSDFHFTPVQPMGGAGFFEIEDMADRLEVRRLEYCTPVRSGYLWGRATLAVSAAPLMAGALVAAVLQPAALYSVHQVLEQLERFVD